MKPIGNNPFLQAEKDNRSRLAAVVVNSQSLESSQNIE